MGWLEGNVAIVTGGGSGLGRALVERFIKEGARVGVLERSAERGEELRRDFGDQVEVVTGDVTTWEDNARVVEQTAARFGRLDTFIANAGIFDFTIFFYNELNHNGPFNSILSCNSWIFNILINEFQHFLENKHRSSCGHAQRRWMSNSINKKETAS